jgi:hypothetical protein
MFRRYNASLGVGPKLLLHTIAFGEANQHPSCTGWSPSSTANWNLATEMICPFRVQRSKDRSFSAPVRGRYVQSPRPRTISDAGTCIACGPGQSKRGQSNWWRSALAACSGTSRDGSDGDDGVCQCVCARISAYTAGWLVRWICIRNSDIMCALPYWQIVFLGKYWQIVACQPNDSTSYPPHAMRKSLQAQMDR